MELQVISIFLNIFYLYLSTTGAMDFREQNCVSEFLFKLFPKLTHDNEKLI